MEKPIEQEWFTFCKACFGLNLSKQQYIDLKRTFYGGVKAALNVMSHPSKTAEQTISEVWTELLSFNEDVKVGRQ